MYTAVVAQQARETAVDNLLLKLLAGSLNESL
jgi:hypothetical protein